MRVLLLSKTNAWCTRAHDILYSRYGQDLTWIAGEAATPLPLHALAWQGDLVISFCCPWILPAAMLGRVDHAINFHPAPPEHPGFAPYSWALYLGHTQYGCTVHHMAPRVDTGAIIAVARFPIFLEDAVWDLQQRALAQLLGMLQALQLPDCSTWSGDAWTRPPRTRREFELLRMITPEMSAEEIARRTRACAYPGHEGVYYAEATK